MFHKGKNMEHILSISRTAHNFIHRINALVPRSTSWFRPQNSEKRLEVDVRLSVPYPRPISAALVSVGVRPSLAEQASRAYLATALQLKRAYEERIRAVSRVWLQTNFYESPTTAQENLTSVKTTFVAHYQRTLSSMVQETIMLARERLALASAHHLSDKVEAQKGKRSAFNQDAVPVLEEVYFRKAYPTREEREELAARFCMQPQQIKVWFQNRRARSKRSGHETRRTPEFVGKDIHHPQRIESQVNRSQVVLPKSSTQFREIVTSEAPKYAFPSKYQRALVSEDRVAFEDGLMHFEIPWIRSVGSFRPEDRPVSDISDLTYAFSKLSLGSERTEDTNRSQPPFNAAFIPTASSARTRPVKSHAAPPIVSWDTVKPKTYLSGYDAEKRHVSSTPMRRLSARSSLREVYSHHLSRSTPSSQLYPQSSQPYPQSRPSHRLHASLSKRAPQTSPSHSPPSRSSSLTSVNSDGWSSSGAGSPALVTPSTPTFDLPDYSTSEKKQKKHKRYSPYSSMDYSLREKSACAPRTFQFRTTIAAF
ncbi:unnamed protein product [Somion occarium]|uniref:Homeobox domain-containing protein n=1 Tax=Somion occarium TaxID=3059160 RepID=A0ABP1CH32_9APHY